MMEASKHPSRCKRLPQWLHSPLQVALLGNAELPVLQTPVHLYTSEAQPEEGVVVLY